MRPGRTPWSRLSWAASPSVTFALLQRLDDDGGAPPGEAGSGEGLAEQRQSSLGSSQDEDLEEEQEQEQEEGEEEEEEEEEEESTESEPEPEPMEEEFDGILTEDAASEALHKLGRSAPGTGHVYLNLSLPNRSLSDITVLSRYVHLEKLNLSYNKINDLACVSHMPYLLELDVSHNELTTYFDFQPPKNLQVVNFSHNKIPEMRDLSAYQSLKKLILDNNNIEVIQGLEKCYSLTYLSLANNRLSTIGGLQKLPLKTLCLSSNQIQKAVGLEELKALQTLDLSGNQIHSLEGLEEHNLLEVINLEDNRITELSELQYIESLPLLRVFNLINNPVQQQPDYWLLVIFMLLRLTKLDHKKITVEEKVAAVNKYDPPPEVVAAQDHITHITYSMMQPQRIFDSTLPSLDAPYPMLVLTGPLACWKRELCHRLCRKFNNYFRYSPCHTTRLAYFGEENRLDYYFVSQEEFDKMMITGKFIASFKYSSFYYGLGRDTIESIAREGLATCVHLEIEGVRSLKNSYFEPRYILLIPMNKEKYGGHLRRKGLFSRPEIEEAVRRVDMYIKVNQDCPGFFDAVINVDDCDEAFTMLTRLIEEFLGLVKPPEPEVAVLVSESEELPAMDSLHPPDEASAAKSSGKKGPGPRGAQHVRPSVTSQDRSDVACSKSSVATQKTAATSKGNDNMIQPSHTNEFLDSSAKNYTSRISESLSADKTPVEEASLQRRQQTARQGLMGKASHAYSQLFQRDHGSTPTPVTPHPRFLEPTSYTSMMSSGSTLSPDRSPDQRSGKSKNPSGSKESRTATGLSLTSSAGAFSSASSAARTPVFSFPSADESNGEPEDGKEVDVPADAVEKKSPKPKATSPRIPQVTVRPGSNTKPVLPPIPSGRKKTNP